jgi:hypothetical protein
MLPPPLPGVGVGEGDADGDGEGDGDGDGERDGAGAPTVNATTVLLVPAVTVVGEIESIRTKLATVAVGKVPFPAEVTLKGQLIVFTSAPPPTTCTTRLLIVGAISPLGVLTV